VESVVCFGFFCQKKIAQTKNPKQKSLGFFDDEIPFFKGIC